MEQFIQIMVYVSWVFAPMFTFLFIDTFFTSMKYHGSASESIDNMNGIKRTFHPVKPFVYAVIFWCVIFSDLTK